MIAHFKRIGVAALELMPIVAWLDERHLGPLGLRNAWGYQPVAMMALDPRLCPGGIRELASTVKALHAEGIAVLLDVVFNHSAESDQLGPTVSMRGIDNLTYYRTKAIRASSSTTPAVATPSPATTPSCATSCSTRYAISSSMPA